MTRKCPFVTPEELWIKISFHNIVQSSIKKSKKMPNFGVIENASGCICGNYFSISKSSVQFFWSKKIFGWYNKPHLVPILLNGHGSNSNVLLDLIVETMSFQNYSSCSIHFVQFFFFFFLKLYELKSHYIKATLWVVQTVL